MSETEEPKPAKRRPKYKQVDREQGQFLSMQPDKLVGPEHPVRMIWALTGRLNLSIFDKEIASVEGEAGAPSWPPQLLAAIWIYGYSQGISSARELERGMEWEPGLRWLSGNEIVNHHTLSDFRVGKQEQIKSIFTQVLALMASEQMLDLKTLLQDGTKIKAIAGKGSFHRRPKLEQHLEEAKVYVEELEKQAAQQEQQEQKEKDQPSNQAAGKRSKKEAAVERAARERLERMEAAMEQMRQREKQAGEKKQTRVSESEAEARKMKHPHGGWEPSYNLQTRVEAKNKVIVTVGVVNECNDLNQAGVGLGEVEKELGQKPEQLVADNGYASRKNVEELAKQDIELIAPWKSDESRQAGGIASGGIDPRFAGTKFVEADGVLICPEAKQLIKITTKKKHGVNMAIYQANAADCQSCPSKQQCCPSQNGPAKTVGKVVESQAMQDYQQRMAEPEIIQLYKSRSEKAEFPFLWFKGLWNLRRFSVRGLVKVNKEAIWMAIAYNVQQYMRIKSQRVNELTAAAA